MKQLLKSLVLVLAVLISLQTLLAEGLCVPGSCAPTACTPGCCSEMQVATRHTVICHETHLEVRQRSSHTQHRCGSPVQQTVNSSTDTAAPGLSIVDFAAYRVPMIRSFANPGRASEAIRRPNYRDRYRFLEVFRI